MDLLGWNLLGEVAQEIELPDIQVSPHALAQIGPQDVQTGIGRIPAAES